MPARTKCVRGLHDLTDPTNVIVKKDGSRQCRPCQRAAVSAYRARRDAGEPPLYPRLPPEQEICEVEGCELPRRVAGTAGRSRYCHGHQARQRAYGETFADVPIGYRPGTPLPEVRAELAAGRSGGA